MDNINLASEHYTIHYTKNQKLYFNNKQLRYWDQIASSILEEERLPKNNAVSNIVIFADKTITYAFIERIRHEIGKVWNGYIHFKGDDFKSTKGLSFYISGSGLFEDIIAQAGSYIFEVARRNYGGKYYWYEQLDQPILVTGQPDFEISILAFQKVKQRIENGYEDNIPFFFAGYSERVKKAIKGDSALIT